MLISVQTADPLDRTDCTSYSQYDITVYFNSCWPTESCTGLTLFLFLARFPHAASICALSFSRT